MFDAKSINFLFGLFSACIGLVFVYFLIAHNRKNWQLITFTISKFFQAFAVFGYSLQYVIPDFYALKIGSTFLILGYALEVYNVATFDGRIIKSFLLALAIPIIPTLIMILFFPQVSYKDLIIPLHFMASYCFGLGAFYLFKKVGKTRFVLLVALTYTLFSLTWLYSAVIAFLSGGNLEVLTGQTTREVIIYVFATVNMIIGSVGYLIMLKELDEQQITEKNKIIASDNLKLEELNAKKDKFFSIIAHDLKGPIGGLMNLGEILHKKHQELDADRKNELFQLLVNSTKETSTLLENLLQWSRSETERIEIVSEPLNISEVVDKCLTLLRQNIEEKHISIRKDLEDDVSIMGDPNMIDTVMRNLISNAIKYVNEQGSIAIRSKLDAQTNQVSIQVIDDGVGIEPKALVKLFEIDSTYSKKGTNNEPGTGLGLKICKEFITANKGTIQVASKLHEGSVFTITLPAHQTTKPNN